MKTLRIPILTALVLTGATAAFGLGARGDNVRTSVEFHEPENFTDFKSSDFASARDQEWLAAELRREVERLARRELPAGFGLKLRFTDIDMAGDFEPWRRAGLHDTRIVREIYPPRLSLQYEVTDASGEVVASGERRLIDMNHLQRLRLNRHDPLSYETELLSDFLRDLRREIG